MDTFDIYFASCVAMSLHPGYTKPETKPLSLNRCGVIAAAMVEYKEQNYHAVDDTSSVSRD